MKKREKSQASKVEGEGRRWGETTLTEKQGRKGIEPKGMG